MLAAPPIDLTFSPRRKAHWVPLALSALLHVLLALVWLGFPVPESRHDAEPVIQVELAPEPPPAPAKAAGDGAARQTAPAAEAGIPVPQLEEGILARRSSRPAVKEEAAPVPPTAHAEAPAKPKKPEPVTQNDRDFVLGQVMRHWSPPRELVAYDRGTARVAVTVGADGYFTDIYDSRRPWNPGEVFDGYGALPPQDIQRRTIDAFYRAIRQAQPVRLPPPLRAKAPFPVRLDFRFRDVR